MMDFDFLTHLNVHVRDDDSESSTKGSKGSSATRADRILAQEDEKGCGVCALGTNLICPNCRFANPYSTPINLTCWIADYFLQVTWSNDALCQPIRNARPWFESICGCEKPLPISTLRLKTNMTTPPFMENDQDDLAGYVPMTPVEDANAIVFDYMAIHAQLVNGHRLENAMALYERGGNSGSYAALDLDGAGSPLSQDIPKGTPILGVAQDDEDIMVRGVVLDDAIAGDDQIRVLYDSSKCWVGALANIGQAVTDGCFQSPGSVVAQLEGGLELTLSYSNVRNLNGRTLKKLSLQSGAMLEPSIFPIYVTYLGDGYENYADRIIQDAFSGIGHFSGSTIENRAMFLDRAIVTLEIWMAVVAEMENALRSCRSVVGGSGGSDENAAEGWDPSVASWDRAVSYYVGSPPKPSQNSGGLSRGRGGLLYLVADLFCSIFSTCLIEEEGTNNSAVTLVASVNRQIIAEFSAGQSSLMEGDCNAAQQSKDYIVNKMKIPLIQGAIFYASNQWNYDKPDLARMTGLAFMIPLVPLVAECNLADAYWFKWAMTESAVSPMNFLPMLQNHYECMGVTCDDIGVYLPTGFPPCSDEHHPTGPVAAPSWQSGHPPSSFLESFPIASPTYPYPTPDDWNHHGYDDDDGKSQSEILWIISVVVFILVVLMCYCWARAKRSSGDAVAENESDYPVRDTSSSTDDAAVPRGGRASAAAAANLQPQHQQPPISNYQKLLRLKVLGAIFPEQTVTKTVLQYDSEASSYRWKSHETGEDDYDDDHDNNDDENNDDDKQHKDGGGAMPRGDTPGGGSGSSGKMSKKASMNKNKTNTMCSICLDCFAEGDGIVVGACFHTFHRKCVMDWFLMNDNCPMCRQSMWDQDTFQVLLEEERQRSILREAEPGRLGYC